MGFQVQATSTKETLQDFNSVVNTAVLNVVNDASTACVGVEQLDLRVGSFLSETTPDGTKIFSECPVNAQGITVNQFNTQTCNLTQDARNNLEQNISNQLNNDIKNWINNNLSQNQGWLGLGVQIATTQNLSVDDISNELTNSLTANINNQCSSFLQGSEDGIVSICGDFGNKGITVNQNIVQTNITSCITRNTEAAIANNSIINNIAQQVDNKLSQSEEGVFDWLRWLIIGGVVIAVVIIVAVLMFFIFGSKGGKSQDQGRFREALERRALESREEGIASSSRLDGLERSAEDRVEGTRFELSPEARQGYRNLADRFGGIVERFGKRFA